ncbi:MAG: hypothetical protein ACI4EN_09660 [Butyrivibrio sp.]
MKSLIRFEDTYGLADIFCARRNIPYIDISKVHLRMIEIDENTFIDFGLGAGWGIITTDEIYSIIERGIERIVFVYDMDNESGDKTKIISNTALANKLNNIKELFRKNGFEIDICCIPVVYAAETIMLHQYISESGEYITGLVNLIDTNIFHLCLLSYFANTGNLKAAKKVRDFLDINSLIHKIKNTDIDDINKELKAWIVDGCSHETKILSIEEALMHRENVARLFIDYRRRNKDELFTINDIEMTFKTSKNRLLEILNLKEK